MLRRLLLPMVLLSLPLTARAEEPGPKPEPETPLQTRPAKTDDSWILQGWVANILGISGGGKTLLVVNGDAGYISRIELDGQVVEQTHPGTEGRAAVTFELADKDHRLPLKVKEPRGAEWGETVDVPKGMKVTVEIMARYEHRGWEGTIKNDTLTCKKAAQKKHMRFEIWQGETMIGNPILLEPGKSAPGVRLKMGTYDLKISVKKGKEYVPYKTVKLEPKEHLWRHDEGCE